MSKSRVHHGYTVHGMAVSFPLMEKFDKPGFAALVEDIKKNGLQEPIVLDGEVLIDGRNRLSACKEAGVEPRFVQFSEISKGLLPHEYIMSQNFHRRHLDAEGKAFVLEISNTWPETVAAEQERARFAAQFKKGVCPNPAGRKGKAKEQANTDSYSPASRDTKAMNARSSVGRLAAEADEVTPDDSAKATPKKRKPGRGVRCNWVDFEDDKSFAKVTAAEKTVTVELNALHPYLKSIRPKLDLVEDEVLHIIAGHQAFAATVDHKGQRLFPNTMYEGELQDIYLGALGLLLRPLED